MGYDHRFITPLHASANGISERLVQSVKRALAKATHGIGNEWDLHLNAIQLALNNRISKKLNSTPFSLMFARKMIEPYGFRSQTEKNVPPEKRKAMSHDELLKRIDYMTDIVFPAIHAKTMEQIELEQAKFNNKHTLVDYPPDSHVMVRLPTKAGQLAPAYEGPYTVVRKNQGNSYVLRDHTGAMMPRNYTSIELKLISHDEVIEVDDEGNELKSYEVEAILNHRGPYNKREYLVRWKNYSSEWDEWIHQKQFNATKLLREYWKKLGIPYKEKKSKYTNSPTSANVLRKNPPGTISKLVESIDKDLSKTDVIVSTSKNNKASSVAKTKDAVTTSNTPIAKRKQSFRANNATLRRSKHRSARSAI